MLQGSAALRPGRLPCAAGGSLPNTLSSSRAHQSASGIAARAVAAPDRLQEAQRPAHSDSDCEESYDGGTCAASPATPSCTSPGRTVLESEDELRSSWEHRAWVWSASALMAGTLANGLSHLHGVGGALSATAAVGAAYVLADLGTGIYHWSVDNYGSAATPVFGGQIAAFQGHHQRPWTITEREFANNVHKVFRPAAPVAAALLAASLAAPLPLPAELSVFSSSFLFLACMSQQFHAWAHMKRRQLHPAVVAAQDAGVLISRRAHGAHHKAPFEGNYCIVSGMWNGVLDKGGAEDGFFRMLERQVYAVWGVEPRCWHEPGVGWEEEVRDS